MKPDQQSGLSHIDESGRARMVDVGAKKTTARGAIAEGAVRVSSELAQAIAGNAVAKGNVFEIARIAGVLAAKKTSEIIPLCHPLGLDYVDVAIRLDGCVVRISAEARLTARTGVEMEALTAVMAAALTVIDMGKAIDKGMVIEGVRLLEKWGGRSGHYTATEQG